MPGAIPVTEAADSTSGQRHPVIHPVVLCGGSGTRLWPMSRRDYPKQFVPLVGPRSLYQNTLLRLSASDFAAPLIITGDAFRFLVTDQAEEAGISDARVVVEPEGRDTAPAILTAALMLMEEDPGAIMLIAPSDHVIADPEAFREAVRAGCEPARSGAIVTFGAQPERPETGYGYLHLETPLQGPNPVPLKEFREKPDLAEAEAMIAGGRHLWNTGIFLARAADLVAAFETHAPDMLEPCQKAIATGEADLGFFRLGAEAYGRARTISFDFAIMEKLDHAVAVPLAAGWSDLGTWEALWQAGEADEHGNVRIGSVTTLDCTDSYFRSDGDGQHLVGLGVRSVVAVATRDAVLVADRAHAQDLKLLVNLLREAGLEQADLHPRVHRPWGWYERLCIEPRFQVKRIMVKPGGILSLQSHVHRSEHWVVVAGTAEVTLGKQTRLVAENESVYIPLGIRHRLSNPGKVPMYLIEVQTGAYLGEDDIQRYEDIYSRA